jgi:hypothetical protein
MLMSCFVDRGELVAAVATAASFSQIDSIRVPDVELEQGSIVDCLAIYRDLIGQHESQGADEFVMNDASDMVSIIERAYDSEQAIQVEIGARRSELERVETFIMALSGPDGPSWYPIQLLTLRARLLTLTSETRPQAIDLARQARDLARTVYPDLLPQTGRTLADLLLQAHLPADALSAVADAEPYAAENGFLEERARLLSARLLAHVQLGVPPATLDSDLTALRDALAATDSPRITAETLRDLAKRLPPTCTHPDPLVLAEEALDLFVPMPMPAQEARCLEIMGDALLARGNPAEAKRRYLTARARLERYGLGLRLPLLSRKIDAIE